MCAEAVLPTPAPTVQLECGTIVYEYDPAYIERRYEILNLKVIHRRRRTGFEETKDFPIRVNDLIAGRYQVRHRPHAPPPPPSAPTTSESPAL